jgi:hypothetical protein
VSDVLGWLMDDTLDISPLGVFGVGCVGWWAHELKRKRDERAVARHG